MQRLPDAIVERLAGDAPDRCGADGLHESHRLTTLDQDGWPRTAQLSAGEVLAADDGSLRLCTWPGSRTAANLRRDGRALLSVVADGACWDLRLDLREVPAPPGAPPFAYFRGRVESAEAQRANYATVERGVAFRLPTGSDAPARWKSQLDALRSLA
jgi:hypothetical protein